MQSSACGQWHQWQQNPKTVKGVWSPSSDTYGVYAINLPNPHNWAWLQDRQKQEYKHYYGFFYM